MNLKIPKSFKLFATTYNILWDNKRMNDLKCYGESDYSSSTITLSHTNGVDELSEDKILDTWYHERTHAILDTMGEHELSKNEKFVDTFSKLLRQTIETEQYDDKRFESIKDAELFFEQNCIDELTITEMFAKMNDVQKIKFAEFLYYM